MGVKDRRVAWRLTGEIAGSVQGSRNNRDPVSPGGQRDQRTVSGVGSLALELQMVVSCLADAGNKPKSSLRRAKTLN